MLTVIGYILCRNNKKKYAVHCSLCEKDKELFGEGVSFYLKGDLIRGVIRCGCSKSPNWTEEQYIIRCKRKAKEKNAIFISFAQDFKGHETKLLLCCKKHGEWSSCSLNMFLNSNYGCPKCKAEKLGERNSRTEDSHILDFFKTGKFKKETVFTKLEKRNWSYICPVCSVDEYVKNGVCDGVFKSTTTPLKNGTLSCRCSKSFLWDQKQREYQINKRIKDGNLKYRFVEWSEGSYKNPKSKFIFKCSEHGEQEISVNWFVNQETNCAGCNGHNQKEFYINIVYDNELPICVKFGIANYSTQRLKSQNNKNKFKMELLCKYSYKDAIHCKKAEKICKKSLTCGILSSKDLNDGWTETTHIDNIENIKFIATKMGGTIVI